jgi:hypothetical protein
MVGRYVMIKWHPTAAQPDGFSIAQVAAFGVSNRDTTLQTDGKDGKEFYSGKEGKEPLGEGEAPGEGPPPGYRPCLRLPLSHRCFPPAPNEY